jgi:hypothetical protein
MHMLVLQSHTISRSFNTRHVASTHDALHLRPLTLHTVLYAIDVRGDLYDALRFRPVILL